MTKLLAAIKELEIPLERLERWYSVQSEEALCLSCVVLIHASWLVLFSELIPVNSEWPQTPTINITQIIQTTLKY